MSFKADTKVLNQIKSYPEQASLKLLELRDLIQEAHKDLQPSEQLIEGLKWSEPAYSIKNGSTIRMDWKEKNPNQVALYFTCSTSLISSFKTVFGKELRFEGNRAILFDIDKEIPDCIPFCLQAALQYHKLKHLPLLGL